MGDGYVDRCDGDAQWVVRMSCCADQVEEMGVWFARIAAVVNSIDCSGDICSTHVERIE